MCSLEGDITLLSASNATAGHQALLRLEEACTQSDAVYGYLEDFFSLLSHQSSYVRTRGWLLIAYNARWDAAGRIDARIDRYLAHLLDEKPTMARQCVQALRQLLPYKPQLTGRIRAFLQAADCTRYLESTGRLVQRDILELLAWMDEHS